jgi:hypothetical protein
VLYQYLTPFCLIEECLSNIITLVTYKCNGRPADAAKFFL